jgi:glycosyltransferase involved in cell wall biosynthesis
MKILMTTDTLGGVWSYCMSLCAALKPHGVHVVLATMGRALSLEQRKQVDQLDNVDVHESTWRLCWMEEPWHDVARAGDWLLSLARRYRPDIIQLNDLGHGDLAWPAPVVMVGHSCVLSWWDAVKKQSAPQAWHEYRERVSASLKNADLIVAPTHAMSKALAHHYGPFNRLYPAPSVIYNGSNFPALADSPTEKFNRAEPLIFAAGRLWDEAKNIAALSSIAADVPWPVYVAGEVDQPNGKGKALDNLHCLGFLHNTEMARWLARASIYVAPARYEPFGLAILEAARAGCALVLGDIESLREVWGEAAEYVDPDNPAELRRVVNQLIDDPQRRQQLSALAWDTAQSYFAEQMANDYMKAYEALVNPAVFTRPRSVASLSGMHI